MLDYKCVYIFVLSIETNMLENDADPSEPDESQPDNIWPNVGPLHVFGISLIYTLLRLQDLNYDMPASYTHKSTPIDLY